ncbi:SagB/ThcOx family dehydrogenase [Dysgonomonas sp. 216]|uniref:SagB/ThcOx family dehydrogenase n=1 Tax=Dysgonomonas sp. 216 TaxID=2302934 RepID=UPI0013CF50B1|nr:SagB/ThcOx family dehydrogenase [Dysgonomonas sp. 216]NDW17784.1 SagB/ThcOx family dehydrogenase [Dysgonomonas sp. 216]
MKKFAFAAFLVCFSVSLFAQDIKLPTPIKTGGAPLMDVLSKRKTEREYTGAELDKQTLSNLLWAAYGFNREDKRTVPSSQNRQEIDVYVVIKNAMYFYDAKTNLLKLHKKGDFSEALGQPHITSKAALSIVYVANLDKASNRQAAYTDTGYISQNVYLFAAANKLGTVARGSFNRELLPKMIGLTDKQEVTLVQPVGVLK